MKSIAIFLFSFVLSAQAFAECQQEKTKSGVKYGWCIDRGLGDDVLYFMHGAGGNEESWNRSGWFDHLQPYWAAQRWERPNVISISFGPQWLLADLTSSIQPAYLQLVVDEIMPYLESKIGGVRGKRLLMGASMGGYNGAELALRNPDLFARVALLCPGLRVVDPFLSDADLEAFLKTLPAFVDRELVTGVVQWVRAVFATREAWTRHDPMVLAENSMQLKSAFFVSCTKDDEYGFHAPAELFASILSKKTPTKFMSIESGGHCAQTQDSWKATAEFLSGK